jgi:hypothetical protein
VNERGVAHRSGRSTDLSYKDAEQMFAARRWRL